MGLTSISSSYLLRVYGAFKDFSPNCTGIIKSGDFSQGELSLLCSLQRINPKDKYRILVPCSSWASFVLERRFFKVFSRSMTVPSALISPTCTGSEYDKVSKSANMEYVLKSESLLIGLWKVNVFSLTASRLNSSVGPGSRIFSVARFVSR